MLYVWFADTFVFGQGKDKENVRRMQDGTCAYVTYIEETNAGRQAERNVKKRNFFFAPCGISGCRRRCGEC
ncbi:hypothetical protein EAI98_10335 [Alistipes finegoldii]|nr:hypothetical protein EAI98_10335 [Alistipes finegoldii]